MARKANVLVALVNLYLLAVKHAGDKMEFAKSELAKLYPKQAEANEIDDDFVKGKINIARNTIRDNFMLVDGQKTRVFKNENGEYFLDSKFSSPVPESANRYKPQVIWEKKTRVKTIDALDDLLTGVDLPLE